MLPDALTEIISAPRLAWAPPLTLLFLLGFPPCSQYMPQGSWAELLGRTHTVLCAVGLFIDPWGQTPAFWFSLAGVHFAWLRTAYFVADNHHYLEGYWCLAIAIALSSANGERWIQLDATLMLGLCFALAVVAKVINPEYRNGSFFTHLLLFDPRFLPIAMAPASLHRIAQLISPRGGAWHEENPSARCSTCRIPSLTAGRVLTWWTVGIESLLAMSFLVPWATVDAVRAGLLCLFVVSTFAMVAVPTFGHILLIMLAVSVNDVTLRGGGLMLACALSLLSFVPTAVWKRVHVYYTQPVATGIAGAETARPRRLPASH